MSFKANPVNWFEIPVTDLQRAKHFYESVFAIEMTLMEMGNLSMIWFPGVQDGSGASGTLIKAKSYTPSYQGSMVYFSVDDIEAVLARVAQNNGKVVNPKSSIGEYGFVAHFEDSEGNRIGLHSEQ